MSCFRHLEKQYLTKWPDSHHANSNFFVSLTATMLHHHNWDDDDDYSQVYFPGRVSSRDLRVGFSRKEPIQNRIPPPTITATKIPTTPSGLHHYHCHY